ncbi:phosphate ABC transporter permease subunit PstC [Rhodothermus marinus]|uniref:phosphate ABC transporter permease subunit PstC n=1 Tax=Rhodothermus marinus TaxID=29549 RepID=UPI0012BA4997|nr:phosphate ABC transporter permease subunit PstC [Rhodothermus marinus]BBM70152.1 phosphate transport system permease protein [Rhodothermus marinus]BBM73138.1 phosphate transport system permease protein [Rhodothermus marinus]
MASSSDGWIRRQGFPDLAPDANLSRGPRERLIQALLGLCALVTVFTTLGIAAILIGESVAFFRQVSLAEFFGDTKWTPQFSEQHFGIWPLLAGTLMITVIAALVAIPIGLSAAIYISQYAPDRVRRWLKPSLELLAGVPTVVYGYFALTFVTPLLQHVLPQMQVYNALSAGIVVGIMIIPMVASLSEDALRAVPRSLAEGAYALGATKYEVVLRVVVPAALSGIMASFILALSRAIGETMIVTLAAGATPKLTLNPLESIQTMTAYIVQVSLGDTPQGTVVYQSLFAVGLVLFVLTLGMNLLANRIILRFKETY